MPTANNERINHRVLIVDDSLEFHRQLRYDLRRNYEFEGVTNLQNMSEKLESGMSFDLILLDMVLEEDSPEKASLLALPDLIRDYPDIPVIVVTNYPDFPSVVKAIQTGAVDFLPKNEYDPDLWDEKIQLAIHNKKTRKENENLKKENRELNKKLGSLQYEQPPKHPFLGVSSKIERIRSTLKIVADEPNSVLLLTGETGVGKGIAARFYHYNSHSRRQAPFEEIHISTITHSLLESTLFGAVKGSFTDAKTDIVGRLQLADKGVVFLDEIGDLTLENQMKLLQFMQTRVIRPMGGKKDIVLDVNIVAATNKILSEEIREGRFRLDLFQRLNVLTIEIPPLRERREDIWPLMERFFDLYGGDLERLLEKEVITALTERYQWPGNIRELENAVRKMLIQQKIQGTKTITWECLPVEIIDPSKAVFTHLKPAQGALLPNTPLAAQPVFSTPASYVPAAIMPPELTIEAREAWLRLEQYERALIEYRGHKKDVAEALGTKPDLILYRIKTYNRDYHDFFQYFPNVCRYYKIG